LAGRIKPTNRRQRARGNAALPRVGVLEARKPPANDNRVPSGLLVRHLVSVLTLMAALAILFWVGITSM
jgi:hypothetical protein